MAILETRIGKVCLQTPLLLASGHITETPDFFIKSTKCSGVITRSLKENPPPERNQTPSPRYVIFDDGKSMLNCEWGNSVPWTEWRDHGVQTVKKHNGAIIISLSGRDIQSCCRLISEFDKLSIDAYEINISCAHSGALHGNLNTNFAHLEEVLTTIRPLTQTPIWIKLSFSPFLTEMARTAEKFGADAIVCTNSIGPGMFINTETATPILGIKGGAGGMTGRAIFPIALNCVYLLAQTVKIPIIGSGGVFSSSDVIQMMMAGASAVQLYTAPALSGPDIFKKISDELVDFCNSHRYNNIQEMIGLALGKRDSHNFTVHFPTINQSLCVGCGRCARVCNFGAIFQDTQFPIINKNLCVGCSACVSICSSNAMYFEESYYG